MITYYALILIGGLIAVSIEWLHELLLDYSESEKRMQSKH